MNSWNSHGIPIEDNTRDQAGLDDPQGPSDTELLDFALTHDLDMGNFTRETLAHEFKLMRRYAK